MEKIVKYTATIKGAAPLIMNRLDKELNDEFKKIERDKRDEWQENCFMKKTYTRNIDGKDELILPEMLIHKFLQESAMRYRVAPPKSIGRTWTQYFKGCVVVDSPAIIKCAKVDALKTMVNGNPSSAKKSSKVYTVRPIIYEWETQFSFMDAGTALNKETVEGILKTGSLFVGVGDWRPQHGRFKVVKLETTDIRV